MTGSTVFEISSSTPPTTTLKPQFQQSVLGCLFSPQSDRIWSGTYGAGLANTIQWYYEKSLFTNLLIQ